MQYLSGIEQALMLVLMMIALFTLVYAPIDLIYRIGIVVFAFTVMFLATLAIQILRAQKEALKRAAQA
jgi:4-hydroxybenzoate polyprenyltransferase